MRYRELLETARHDLLQKVVSDELLELRQAFQQHDRDIRFVGGAVRDILSGKAPKDIDLATDADPSEQAAIYRQHGYRYIETGIEHGTITVLLNDVPHEITSLRTESEHDGRHAKVAYTRDWVEDLGRRDFTVNAMALTFDGELIDPFGGQGDLQRGVIKYVGRASDRMREDYLRILRFFRFHGRLNNAGTFDPDTAAAIRAEAEGLRKISGERIWAEVAKIISGPNGPAEIRQMCKLGVAKNIGLPCKNIEVLRTAYALTREPVTLLCAILDEKAEVTEIVNRWKLSGEEREFAYFLVKHKHAEIDRDALQDLVIDGAPQSWAAELARLHGKSGEAAGIAHWQVPPFPVLGRDLLAMGMKPGPAVGDTLRRLKTKWVKSRFKLRRDELLAAVAPEPEPGL